MHVKYLVLLQFFQVIHMAQRLERRCKDIDDYDSWIRIPLWDVGIDPSDETV
jgi:hypothetical protein